MSGVVTEVSILANVCFAPEAAISKRECDVTIIRGTLPQLKGGDAEYPLQPQRQDRAGIHTRSLEHWHEPQVLRQRDRVAVDAGNVEEYLPAADAGQQSRQDHLGGGAVVGHQRADLATLAAWTDDAPTDKLAIAPGWGTDMPPLADPGAQ